MKTLQTKLAGRLWRRKYCFADDDDDDDDEEGSLPRQQVPYN
jgi:hypothetical protein